MKILDHNNGKYTVKYIISSRTDHKLSVYVQEKPIYGSPFHISVSTGVDVNRIGPMLTKFGAGGVGGNGKADTYEPWGIICDNEDRLIATDHNNHKIQVSINRRPENYDSKVKHLLH